MEKQSGSKLGGTTAIAMGVLYLLMGLIYVLMPDDQKAYMDLARFWPSVAETPVFGVAQSVAWFLIGILALAAVPAISKLISPQRGEFLSWIQRLCLFGFAVTALQEIRSVALSVRIAEAYVAGNDAVKASIIALQGVQGLDPLFVLVYGLVGLWFFSLNLTALIRGALPKALGIVGIAGGVAYWLALIGNVFQIIPIVIVAAIAAIIVGPIWLCWIGALLLRGKAAPA
jgi:hypothetical protein